MPRSIRNAENTVVNRQQMIDDLVRRMDTVRLASATATPSRGGSGSPQFSSYRDFFSTRPTLSASGPSEFKVPAKVEAEMKAAVGKRAKILALAAKRKGTAIRVTTADELTESEGIIDIDSQPLAQAPPAREPVSVPPTSAKGKEKAQESEPAEPANAHVLGEPAPITSTVAAPASSGIVFPTNFSINLGPMNPGSVPASTFRKGQGHDKVKKTTSAPKATLSSTGTTRAPSSQGFFSFPPPTSAPLAGDPFTVAPSASASSAGGASKGGSSAGGFKGFSF